ncbi:RNA polymerase sigma factor SigJ [Pseudorhodoplanes sinuspersici]|uniref:RNA polymerase subunit sigma-24 n=1 Tax=Pseudorhodoplanes sinuspersici TaxID=1235591 RepID=A0A1W6ZY10_9HYPH|nr:RNA polymerase sigma factor SigJ [Pseudorhodoplanes sinuspersici]ARQ02158.1 RNA polymerase subunit sigma-24 [Pseudorhodoplanes sinuspersici]RKE73968.1 RNA polymerase sigma-70 factor (ECF subfamily) [Pseudorhodoplanes sinuspersici]
MRSLDHLQIFEMARPRLLGLAYRILGSRADAEDAVQDTFLKWQNADVASIDNPSAWLTTICTRHCLDLLRAAHRSRVNYVGSWLPEPIHLAVDNEAEKNAELSSSLTTAFLLILERLTPKERAAYLLHEIFEMPYPQIASTLDLEEAACRQLVSRAKQHIDQARVRHVAPAQRQEELLSAFQVAITKGETAQLAALLSDDIRFTSDGGGKVTALLEVLHGKADVMAFIRRLHSFWTNFEWRDVNINGARGVLILENGAVNAAISFAYDEADRLSDIYVVRNPDKLAMLDVVAIQ